MLETLNEKKFNIENQIMYVNIISHSMVDIKGRPIIQYQNKCQQDLFSQSGSSKSKLLQFGIVYDKPIVIFNKNSNKFNNFKFCKSLKLF